MKKYLPFFSLVALALLVRLTFMQQTGYIAEDAHITFQFARNLARGDGFSLNPGQPIYGSTTPLLTILLAVAMRFFENIATSARIIGILGIIGGMWFLWEAFKNKYVAVLTLVAMALSARLYVEEMSGMEMPLLFLFFAGSYYGYVKDRPIFAGAMVGLMLWTRIDSVVWVVCLFIVWFFQKKRASLLYGLVTVGIYLPWLLFAWIYFGSPIPFTIIAKQVAYPPSPYLDQLAHIGRYMTGPIVLGVAASGIVALKTQKATPLPLFLVVDVFVLVASGSTFFDRYFYLITIVSYILLGIGVAWILSSKPVWVYATAILFIGQLSYPKIQESLLDEKNLQDGRHKILVEMGTWFNENSPEDSTILLEPLGYVGWYADRKMLDEVGLVTPPVVELHRNGIKGSEFFKYLQPDYVVWTCGEGGAARTDINNDYQLVALFDAQVSRGCYEIWMQ